MPSIEHASIVRPLPGERVGGDAVLVREDDEVVVAWIIDVLGHGREAHDLAVRIESFLREQTEVDVVHALARLGEHIRGSRGAAAGVAAIDLPSGTLRYAGVGNTAIRRLGAQDTRLVSRDGILGGEKRSPIEQQVCLQDGDVIILHTDGIRWTFDAAEYPNVMSDSPREITRNILHRFGKRHDDAGCIAMRYRR